MVEVTSNLYVGSDGDYENLVKGRGDWFVVQACKVPYHKEALGYRGMAAPSFSPEYLFAHRENRLILNLVDSEDPAYIIKTIIDYSLLYIRRNLFLNNKVLVHCNRGESRSAGIAFLHLLRSGLLPQDSYETAKVEFKKIYPPFKLSRGMSLFIQENFTDYLN